MTYSFEGSTLSFSAAVRDVGSANNEWRKKALIALGDAQPEQEEEAIALLTSQLGDSDNEVRAITCYSLGKLSSGVVVESLLAMVDDEEESVVIAALDALSSKMSDAILSSLAGKSTERSHKITAKICEIATMLDTAEATRFLLSHLSHVDPRVVALCAVGLRHRSGPEIETLLQQAYTKCPPGEPRFYVAVALAHQANVLKAEVSDYLAHPETAWDAIDALVAVGSASALNELMNALRSSSTERTVKCRIAGALCSEESTPSEYRQEAMDFLHRMTRSISKRTQGMAIQELAVCGNMSSIAVLEKAIKLRRSKMNVDEMKRAIERIQSSHVD